MSQTELLLLQQGVQKDFAESLAIRFTNVQFKKKENTREGSTQTAITAKGVLTIPLLIPIKYGTMRVLWSITYT